METQSWESTAYSVPSTPPLEITQASIRLRGRETQIHRLKPLLVAAQKVEQFLSWNQLVGRGNITTPSLVP